MRTDQVTITRTQMYASPGRYVHVAWKWVYTVHADGQTYKGAGIAWARDLAKAKANGRPIVESWGNQK